MFAKVQTKANSFIRSFIQRMIVVVLKFNESALHGFAISFCRFFFFNYSFDNAVSFLSPFTHSFTVRYETHLRFFYALNSVDVGICSWIIFSVERKELSESLKCTALWALWIDTIYLFKTFNEINLIDWRYDNSLQSEETIMTYIMA